MSTLKNHTKNQLARISAKINHLKRKYPTYSNQQNEHGQNHSDREPQVILKNSLDQKNSYLYQKMNQKRCISNSKSKNQVNLMMNGQKTQNLITPRLAEINYFYEIRDKQNLIPESTGLFRQKPLQQYKEELKHLKRQILSSLDFQNFQQSKGKIISTNEKEKQNSFKVVPKEQTYKKQSLIRIKQESISNESFSKISKIQRQSISQSHLMTSQNILQMKRFMNNLSSQLIVYKKQCQIKFRKLDEQIDQLKNGQKLYESKIMQIQSKVTQSKPLQLKFIQIQNQSIKKIQRQMYLQLQKTKDQIFMIKQKIEQIKNNNNQSINSKQLNIKYQQFQKRIFQKIFDLKNQIKFIQQKIKKQNYIEKNLKKILDNNPNNLNNQKIDLKNIQLEIKSNLINNKQFIINIKNKIIQQEEQNFINIINQKIQNSSLKSFDKYCKQQFYYQILQDVTEMNSKFFNQINLQIKNNKSLSLKNIDKNQKQIQTISKLFKQSQTKLISYGILLQIVQQNIKDLTEKQKDKNQQLQKMYNSINQMLDHRLTAFIDELQKIKNSKVQDKQSNQSMNQEQRQYSKDQKPSGIFKFSITSIEPIVIQPCILSQPIEQNDLKVSQFIKSDIKISPNIIVQEQIQTKKKFVLLDQLLKNSLVFQAYNDNLN